MPASPVPIAYPSRGGGGHRKQARERDGKAQPGSNTFTLPITGQTGMPVMKTSTRGVPALHPPCSITRRITRRAHAVAGPARAVAEP